MKKIIFKTNNDYTGLVTRLTLAFIMIPHTIQHTTGGLGGYGYSGMMQFFTNTVHIPWIVGFLVICTEVIAPALLLIGFVSRMASIALIFLMTGIIFTSHIHNGFFMNWLGNLKGEGYEYHLLYIGLCVATLINGSGKFSVDGKIAKSYF